MLVERRLLNKAWRNYREFRRELKEYDKGYADFHVFLGVDRFFLTAWATEGDKVPGYFSAELSPLQLGKLNALALATRDNAYIMLKVAIAKYRDVECHEKST